MTDRAGDDFLKKIKEDPDGTYWGCRGSYCDKKWSCKRYNYTDRLPGRYLQNPCTDKYEFYVVMEEELA